MLWIGNEDILKSNFYISADINKIPKLINKLTIAAF